MPKYCPVCHKETEVCQECKGEGGYECEECKGEGVVECHSCGHESECEECDGMGDVECEGCNGKGYLRCKDHPTHDPINKGEEWGEFDPKKNPPIPGLEIK